MGVSIDGYGRVTVTPEATPIGDMQAIADLAYRFGVGRAGTQADRLALTAGQIEPGRLFMETDTGRIFLRTGSGSGWKLVFQDWTEYTPTTTAVTGGTVRGLYRRQGDQIDCQIRHELAGAHFSGQPGYSLPVAAVSGVTEWFQGTVMLRDTSAGVEILGVARKLGTGEAVGPYALNASTPYVQFANVSPSAPFAWANGDVVDMQFSYRCAGG